MRKRKGVGQRDWGERENVKALSIRRTTYFPYGLCATISVRLLPRGFTASALVGDMSGNLVRLIANFCGHGMHSRDQVMALWLNHIFSSLSLFLLECFGRAMC